MTSNVTDRIDETIDAIDQFRLTTLAQLEREADAPRRTVRAACEARDDVDVTDCGHQTIVTINRGGSL